jgi:hypothetical protein
MGIGIAPGGGVGLVPLNNPHPQAGAPQPPTNGRGRTRGDHHMQQTATGYATRGPAIAGYAWDAPPATTTRQASTSTGQAVSTSNVANSNGSGRRRDGTPTGSSGSSRFGRGLTERIRALGAAGNPAPVTTALMQQMGIQPPAPSVIAPADPNTVRPRAWERLFGRDGTYGGVLAPTVTPGLVESTPPSREAAAAALADQTNWGRVPRPTRSSSGPSASTVDHPGTSIEVEQMRQYLSLSARNRGVVHLPGHLTDENGPSTSTAPSTDLSGMVRNNLVLAGQPGSSSLPSSNVVAMRVAPGPNERPANGYAPTSSRPGLATRGNSTGGTLTMLDTANATGSMWNTYEPEEGMQ